MPTLTQTPNSTNPTAAPVHLGWLDSLRALAALNVVMYHIVTTVWPQQNNFHGMTLLTAGPFRYGHFAVGFFLVVSGFSLMLPVSRGGGTLRGGVWLFLKHRAKRILPTYYLALALSLLLIHFFIGHRTGTNWDMCISITPSDVLAHLLMLQDIFSYHKINGVFWSISVEWRIYFLFPLLVILIRRWDAFKVTLGMFAFSCLLYLGLQNTIYSGIMPAYFALFTMGMLACEISFGYHEQLRQMRDRLPWLVLSIPILFVYSTLFYVWRADFSPPRLFVLEIFTGVLSAVLLIALSKPASNRLRDYLLWRPLVFIGTFAYSIYLTNLLVIQLIWQNGHSLFHINSLSSYLLLAATGVPMILGGAYLFFLACERPFLNTKKRTRMAEMARDAALAPAP